MKKIRGVGNSTGSGSWRGSYEQDDVKHVIQKNLIKF